MHIYWNITAIPRKYWIIENISFVVIVDQIKERNPEEIDTDITLITETNQNSSIGQKMSIT